MIFNMIYPPIEFVLYYTMRWLKRLWYKDKIKTM